MQHSYLKVLNFLPDCTGPNPSRQ